ncbi:MAG: plastocyanin/azurin family copper-binding protein [Candidatus Aenigmarchaeota archaeon]|nr:plastocyanin/azurin family copper-binding protein [Candidatus Aenigmarchaeota archaeon]
MKFLFVLLIGVLLVAGCTQSGGNNPPPGNQTGNVVRISGFAFIPQTITIKKGETVTWTNEDSVPHQIASDPHPTHTDLPGLLSPALQNGQSYTFTSDKVGTWGYHCHLHPTMKGTAIVTEG